MVAEGEVAETVGEDSGEGLDYLFNSVNFLILLSEQVK